MADSFILRFIETVTSSTDTVQISRTVGHKIKLAALIAPLFVVI